MERRDCTATGSALIPAVSATHNATSFALLPTSRVPLPLLRLTSVLCGRGLSVFIRTSADRGQDPTGVRASETHEGLDLCAREKPRFQPRRFTAVPHTHPCVAFFCCRASLLHFHVCQLLHWLLPTPAPHCLCVADSSDRMLFAIRLYSPSLIDIITRAWL